MVLRTLTAKVFVGHSKRERNGLEDFSYHLRNDFSG
jgi:hypothetical protein